MGIEGRNRKRVEKCLGFKQKLADPIQVFAKVIGFLNNSSAFYSPCTAKIFETAPWRESMRLGKLKVSEEAERETREQLKAKQ